MFSCHFETGVFSWTGEEAITVEHVVLGPTTYSRGAFRGSLCNGVAISVTAPRELLSVE